MFVQFNKISYTVYTDNLQKAAWLICTLTQPIKYDTLSMNVETHGKGGY